MHAWHLVDQQCLFFSGTHGSSFVGARRHCNELHPLATLLQAETISLLNAANNLMRQHLPHPSSAWVGAFTVDEEHPFFWVDGDEVDLALFAPGEPNGHLNKLDELCLEVGARSSYSQPLRLSDARCRHTKPYFCAFPTSPSEEHNNSTTSSTATTDTMSRNSLCTAQDRQLLDAFLSLLDMACVLEAVDWVTTSTDAPYGAACRETHKCVNYIHTLSDHHRLCLIMEHSSLVNLSYIEEMCTPTVLSTVPSTSTGPATQTVMDTLCGSISCPYECGWNNQHMECGWDSAQNRCERGENTSSSELTQGMCTTFDACTSISCGRECLATPGCGWSTSLSMCVTGGHTDVMELNEGNCTCKDITSGSVDGFKPWEDTDTDGGPYKCHHYEVGGMRCDDTYNERFRGTLNLTANAACCVCGGGTLAHGFAK